MNTYASSVAFGLSKSWIHESPPRFVRRRDTEYEKRIKRREYKRQLRASFYAAGLNSQGNLRQRARRHEDQSPAARRKRANAMMQALRDARRAKGLNASGKPFTYSAKNKQKRTNEQLTDGLTETYESKTHIQIETSAN